MGKEKRISILLIITLILSNFVMFGPVEVVKADTINTNQYSQENGNNDVLENTISTATIATTVPIAGIKTLDVVEITDFHGQLLDAKNNQIGAALAKELENVSNNNPNTLLIGGGDLYQGTPVSNVLHGVPVQKVLSKMGMEVTTLGNHEFDWGINVINNETMKNANYEIVCSNLYNKADDTRTYKPYKIINKNGIRIAVIGAILKDAATIVLPANVADYEVKDPITEINACANEIRDNNSADVVLTVIHDGGDSLNTIVSELQGVDAVFGGHTHTSSDDIIKDKDNKDVPTLNASSSGKGYIDFKITLDKNNKIVGFSNKGTNWHEISVTNSTPVDEECKTIVDEAYKDLEPIFNEVIGNDTEVYSKVQTDSPFGESQLGNWMADVVKNKGNADVGIVNNGGIRLDSIPAGDITVGTIFYLMPFDNTVTTVKMTGAELKKVIEQGLADTTGKGLQISGVKITYDSSKQSYVKAVTDSNGNIVTPEIQGKRVNSIVREKDGKTINDSDVIKVAAPDYVATGGDNFTEFISPEIQKTYEDTHILVRDALIENVKANSKIIVTMNKRINNEQVTNSKATISIVATSDVHGNVLNFDYGTNNTPSKGQGLAKVSTYVNNLRVTNPNVMLVDNGDTIQGTPLVYYYNMIDKNSSYPMAKVMGAMKYDTETLGNHEFNYGLDTLNRVMNDYNSQGIHVLSANTYKSDNSNFVEPYYIKEFNINGNKIKVGILGLTTKNIPNWEDPEHYKGLHFNDIVDEAKKWVPIVKSKGADIVIVSAHSGEEGASDVIPENQIKALANNVSGIDAIIAGHTHLVVNDLNVKNPDGKVVPIVQPGKWANYLSQIDVTINDKKVVEAINTKNVQMDNTIAEDPNIISLITPYQEKTLEYTSTVIGKATDAFSGEGQTKSPTSIMELINKVQAQSANTELSIAAPLSATANIPKGDVTIKDIMGTYVYENYLYGVKMNGEQIKKWLEYSARYYKQVSNEADPIEKDSTLNIADYNLDQLYGATYDVDLTKPVGSRILNLKYKGELIKNTDVLTVAINDYRYNGGGGFMKAAGLSNTDPSLVTYCSAKSLGDDGQVRSLIISYIKSNKEIKPICSNNWMLYTENIIDNNNGNANSGNSSISNEKDNWVKINNRWYYMNQNQEKIIKTWKLINSQWYYFEKDGSMNIGWFKDDNSKWYYLLENGSMKTGWLLDKYNQWYYFDKDGSMKNGWVQDSNKKWYYLEENGDMVKNKVVDGYYINEKGEWVA